MILRLNSTQKIVKKEIKDIDIKPIYVQYTEGLVQIVQKLFKFSSMLASGDI